MAAAAHATDAAGTGVHVEAETAHDNDDVAADAAA